MGKKFGNVPYGNATAGDNAREEIVGLLRKMGASHVGFMTDFESGEVQLQFRYRGQNVLLKASAGGWAALALEKNPHNNHMRTRIQDYREQALAQGNIAVYSILRDWIKGSVTAIECGMAQFEHLFMPYMITNKGVTLVEHLQGDKNLRRQLLPHLGDPSE